MWNWRKKTALLLGFFVVIMLVTIWTSSTVSYAEPVDTSGVPAAQHHHPGGALHEEGSVWSYINYGLKIAYYTLFVTLMGWVLWGALLLKRGLLDTSYRKFGNLLQKLHFLAFFGFAFIYIYDLQALDMDVASAMFQYMEGWSILFLFVLLLLSFVILFKNSLVDFIWVLAMIAARTLSGHAAVYQPEWLTIPSYVIHWLGASLWVGGIMMALYVWRTRRDEISALLPLLSKAALWSVIALAITGTLTATIYLPSIEYVYGTAWGQWLLVKIAVVVCVVLFSLFVQRAWRKNSGKLGRLLRIELGLLAVVVLAVGLLTNQHPTPDDEPLDWHVMGEEIHMSLIITPNHPGVNSFVVKVWLPKEQGEPQSVELQLRKGKDHVKIVGLTPIANDMSLSFPGFTEHDYKGQGRYLDSPGTWQAYVKVIDENGTVTEYDRSFEVW